MELDGLFAEIDLLRRKAAANRRMSDAIAAEIKNLKNTRASQQAQDSIHGSNDSSVWVPELMKHLIRRGKKMSARPEVES